jgi:hypothetical protein
MLLEPRTGRVTDAVIAPIATLVTNKKVDKTKRRLLKRIGKASPSLRTRYA